MSCRIMGRNIEKIMLDDLLHEALKENVEELIGQYIPTKKNFVSQNTYQNYGFTKIDDNKFSIKSLNNFTHPSVSYIQTKQS